MDSPMLKNLKSKYPDKEFEKMESEAKIKSNKNRDGHDGSQRELQKTGSRAVQPPL